MLPLLRWWCCYCCLFLRQWMMVSLTTAVAVAAVAAWRQRQRRRSWWWTTIGGESSRQWERWRSHDGMRWRSMTRVWGEVWPCQFPPHIIKIPHKHPLRLGWRNYYFKIPSVNHLRFSCWTRIFFLHIGIGIWRGWTMHRKLHMDTLILIPTFEIYVFSYSRQTDEQTNRRTDGKIHSLRVGWRNFFPVVLLCQFVALVGNRFWFYILLMLLEYHTVVVLC